ncbi:MAG: AAA family ATPase [Bryobacteraceae bacterium]|jgi:predicted ATPase
MSATINRLTIEGFKSIRKLEEFELRSLNVLIGANGAGKSNFVGFFRLLRELIDQRLQLALATEGGADACLYLGPKVTQRLVAKLYFGENRYEFVLVPTVDNRLVFAEERAVLKTISDTTGISLGSGHTEAKLKDRRDEEPGWGGATYAPPHYVYRAVSSWVYHFHDTSPAAGVRRQGPINDNETFRPGAENLAAFLYRIRHTNPASYEKIRDVVRLAAPFFEDFKLRPVPTNPDLIQLEWLQQDSDYPFVANQLSDGTLRFVCLATALLQPEGPPTVLFDEPELGLHPYALTLLGSLFQQAAEYLRKQVIVSTQSAALLNEFSPEDVIVVERSEGQSVFRRLDPADLSEWLEEYTLGELWQKNVLGGRPQKEGAPNPSNGNREALVPAPDGGPGAGDGRS